MSLNTGTSRLNLWLGRGALAVFVAISIAPLWIALKSSVTPHDEMFTSSGEIFPPKPTTFNFERVAGLVDEKDPRLKRASFARLNFGRVLLNSLIFTALVVIPQTLFSALAAYAFARLRFPGRRVIFFMFLASSMIPAAVLFIPNFILIKQLGLLNTYLGMAAPFALMSPFAVFYLRQVFISTPSDVEEAARIDGASYLLIFFRIILPIHKPAIATLVILTSVGAWNEFFWPYLTGRDESVRVLSVALSIFRQQQPSGAPDWTGIMAGAVLAIVPMILLLIVFGRRVVESFQFSGAK